MQIMHKIRACFLILRTFLFKKKKKKRKKKKEGKKKEKHNIPCVLFLESHIYFFLTECICICLLCKATTKQQAIFHALYVDLCMYMSMYGCMYVYVCMYVCMYVYVCIDV